MWTHWGILSDGPRPTAVAGTLMLPLRELLPGEAAHQGFHLPSAMPDPVSLWGLVTVW